MKKNAIIISSIFFLFMSCNNGETKNEKKPVQLVTLDPGHFHAALVQKTMYEDVDSVVHVYAPEGNDLQLHLARINAYNSRSPEPAHWKEKVYAGDDFFEKMIAEKKGNVVVLSGNNRKKTEYIFTSLQNGFNVLADKPMVIDSKGFEQLKQAFDTAAKNKLLLYDIMTERYEITSELQRELSVLPGIFGELEKGTAENPAVIMDAAHYFYKYISGSVTTRPPWFFDVSQQGEGIVDVMTHLVDLVQWECFPDQSVDYTKDIQVNTARRWTTDIKLSEFKAITKADHFPSFLCKNIAADTMLKVSCNGEINYVVRGVHAKTSVVWKYKAAEGTGDTYYSMMRGTKANLVIRQGTDEQYKSTLYIEPVEPGINYETILKENLKGIQAKYPGVELQPSKKGWQVIIPEKYKDGHEAHFAGVTEKFLEYLKNGNMPAWEVPGMLAKYFTTTKALEIALKADVKPK
jgi:predicted dehydrogenase